MTTTDPRTTRLGELTAYDLGSHVTFKDGGATYEGILEQVRHEHRTSRKTFVSVIAGKWRHVESYPSNRPCVVTPVLLTPAGPVAGGQALAIDGPPPGPTATAHDVTIVGVSPALDPHRVAAEIRRTVEAQRVQR